MPSLGFFFFFLSIYNVMDNDPRGEGAVGAMPPTILKKKKLRVYANWFVARIFFFFFFFFFLSLGPLPFILSLISFISFETIALLSKKFLLIFHG
jgi:hypothetical protein